MPYAPIPESSTSSTSISIRTVAGSNTARITSRMLSASKANTGDHLVTVAPVGIYIGCKIIVNTSLVNTRSTPSGTIVGTHAAKDIGTVIAGPTVKALGAENVTWWNITFTTGVSGWVGGDNLSVYTPPVVLPTYKTWMAKLNTEVAINPTPSVLITWLNTNPPVAD